MRPGSFITNSYVCAKTGPIVLQCTIFTTGERNSEVQAGTFLAQIIESSLDQTSSTEGSTTPDDQFSEFSSHKREFSNSEEHGAKQK